MELPSDRVNGVNADVPLDNDGDEKVVEAFLMDDSGPMEKHSQMAKRIINPFPFGQGSESRRRKKRYARRRAEIFSIATGIALFFTAIFDMAAYLKYKHINEFGISNTSNSYQSGAAFTALAGIFIVIAFVLFVFAFLNWLKFSRGPAGIRVRAGMDPGDVQMP